MKSSAVVLLLVAGLGPEAFSQTRSAPPESTPSIHVATARDWEKRLLASDSQIRTTAEAALVQE